jgi:hypothetical protein
VSLKLLESLALACGASKGQGLENLVGRRKRRERIMRRRDRKERRRRRRRGQEKEAVT